MTLLACQRAAVHRGLPHFTEATYRLQHFAAYNWAWTLGVPLHTLPGNKIVSKPHVLCLLQARPDSNAEECPEVSTAAFMGRVEIVH